ncbi:Phytocyanin domain containing protein [Parasponia andersonii]|uniref:Phytocyanin domain containing protein n=1 Tax=Parasponia andersonii TaxID=3476 RepID=A0A2P5BVC7_PARAD|nr:Phytocyanin domain containing protein [Parasponia andersonii]
MEGLRPEWAVKAIVIIIIGSILFRCVSAANYTVGGPSGWDLTSDLQAWTAQTTFHVGDSLVFTYSPVLYDVVEVHQEDFPTCDISHPIKTHKDGETLVPLNQQGTRYFVCGRQGHCRLGQKLKVQVLPPLHNDGGNSEQRRGGGRGRPKSLSTPPSSSGGAASGPHPCPCGGGPEEKSGAGFFVWLVPLVMMLVILSSSWSHRGLNGFDLFGVLHHVIIT